MAVIVGLDPDIVTWVSSYDDGSGLDADPLTQYLYSVYWALTTLTTVGYGDITPTNNVERVFSLFALLTGALIFGYMLSSIGSLVAAMDRQAVKVEVELDEVKDYIRWRGLPRDLVVRVRKCKSTALSSVSAHTRSSTPCARCLPRKADFWRLECLVRCTDYDHYYSRKTAFNEMEILDKLTPALRFDVVKFALKDTIGRIPLFASTLDPMFQLEVFPLFKPIAASPGDIIFKKGDRPDLLYFLIKGLVEVTSGVDGRVLYRIAEGQHFGEQVLTGRRRSATHRASVSCEMFAITREDLSSLFEKRPSEGRVILQAVYKEYARKERMRALSLKLLINRLGKDSLDAAALRMQIAWDRKLGSALDSAVHEASEAGALDQPASLNERLAVRAHTVTPPHPTAHSLASY